MSFRLVRPLLLRALCTTALTIPAIGYSTLASAKEPVGDVAVAGADDRNDPDQSVIVTGQREKKQTGAGTKSDVPLIATPQTITVIDNEELTLRNALSINQALGYVAGVSPNQRGGTVTRYDQLILRGFAPGVFLDGMRLIAGPYSTPQIDFNRIDHIDVVKGPASVLYGNSTPGGLVNLTSKTPDPVASGRFEAQLGNFATRRLVGDLNAPIDADGRILTRVVGGWQKGDGMTAMTFAERWHVSPMVTLSPDKATRLTIIATYQRAPSGGGYSGVPAYGSVLPNPRGQLPRNLNTGEPGYECYDHRANSVAALFTHEFDEHLTVRSNARFQNNRLSYRQIYVGGFATAGAGAARNTNFGVITRGGGGADEDFDTLTIDNSLAAKFQTGPLRHSLLVGLDYQRITGENVQNFNTGVSTNPLANIPTLDLYNPVYGVGLPTFDLKRLSATFVNTYGKRDQKGVYLQDQIAIGRLQLIASGRYDWYHQITINKNPTTAAARAAPVATLSQSAFTMRLGALYETAIGLAPFVSYSESFEPQSGSTYLGQPFVPVTGRQYEGGIKYQPKGTSALFTVSAYDLKRQNVPVGDPLAGTGGIPTNSQIQIGETHVRGVEFEGRGEIVPGFDVIAALTYTDAIITQGTPAVARTATNSGTPTTTGTRQLGTPKWLASTFLSYDFAKRGDKARPAAGFSFGAGGRYVGGSDGTTNYLVVNNVTTFQRFTTKSFFLVDGVIGYDLGHLSEAMDGVSVAVNGTNLFDKRHVAACPFSNSCYFGGARTVVGSLRFGW